MTGALEVVELTADEDAGQWDDFAEPQPGFTHFHRLGWKRIIAECFGHQCLFLLAREPGQGPAGILPLVRVKSPLFGHFIVSMPFLNYGGPLGSEPAVRALADEAARRARESGATLLELRSAVPLPLDWPVSHRKVTVMLDLADRADRVFQQFPAKLRSQIRRPGKEGVTVRFGPDQIDPFFEVWSRHMRDLGTPSLPRLFFRLIGREFPADAWFGCAWLAGNPVAAGAGFRWGDELEMTWAASLSEYNRIAPNMLVYWSFMERAIQEGVRRFNFGRCTPGSGTHRFKRQWGSRDQELWWYQWSRGAVAATPSPDDSRYAWGPRIWRHLPLPAARFLGPRIVKFIP